MHSFEIQLRDATAFFKLLEICAAWVDVLNVDLNDDGLHINTVDAARVALIQLVLYREAFNSYEIQEGTAPCIGLHVRTLLNVLKHAGRDDLVKISSIDDDSISVEMRQPGRKKQYRICQLMVNTASEVIPEDLDFDCEALLPASVLVELCKELKGIGDQVQVEIDTHEVAFEVHSETCRARVSVTPETASKERVKVCISCREPCRLRFSYAFFAKIGAAAKVAVSDAILLQMGPERPLSVLFKVEGGHLNLFLAPLNEPAE